jgi:hypothetical protein
MNRKPTDVDRALARGMTVAELIEALEDMPEDAVVVFGSDYGDICHTEQALVVRKVDELDDETERLEASAYSNSGIAIEPIVDETECDEDESPAPEETSRVVILRS